MRIALTADNPFGPGRLGFAWEHVPPRTRAHLDFGCHNGHFLDGLRTKGIARLVGIDCCGEAIEEGHRKRPHLELIHSRNTTPLPFAGAAFDSVSLLDVLEHVYEQPQLLAELARVLRPGGALIVTVPRQYALSFLDLGNLKFRFPRLHRGFYSLRHGREAYRRRYLENPDGLMGDVSARKRWHEHFRPARLESLLAEQGLSVKEWDGSGFWARLVSPLLLPVRGLGAARAVEQRILRWDTARFSSMNLYCVATKAEVVIAANDGDASRGNCR